MAGTTVGAAGAGRSVSCVRKKFCLPVGFCSVGTTCGMGDI